MPATSSASLALAARLRDLDDASVTRIIRERSISPASLRDIFDLAEALLDPGAIGIALARQTRPTLAALVTAGEAESMPVAEVARRVERPIEQVRDDLHAALDAVLIDLVDDTVTVWPTVVAELAQWPQRGLPGPEALTSVHPPVSLDAVDDADRAAVDRGAAERAFTTMTQITEIVLALAEAPGRLLARGGLSLPDAKRLAEVAGVELDELPLLLDLAALAELVEDDEGFTRATDRSDGWRRAALADRWRHVAHAWVALLPVELVDLLASRPLARWGTALVDFVHWLYPAGGEALDARMARRGAQGERLGITAGGRASTMGAALLGQGADAASAVLAPLVPPDVDQVYLQHDLTVVSPGPLAAHLDERLRRLADVESAGLAGRYRVTSDSVTRAVALGESAEELLAFLEQLSLTGVPQPVEYLIRETAARYGSVRVAPTDADERGGARTLVTSEDRLLLDSLLVDAATAPLGLQLASPGRAVSRFEPAVVLWTLIDARYPAAPVEGFPAPERPGRARPVAPVSVTDSVADAVARIRSGSTVGTDGDDAWVGRQWELAVRGKLAVRATVRMPDGRERSFDLEPTGIAAGRVRGRDRDADVERTLPIASITGLEPLE
ncbi:MAG: helicase-associated domain-containing protein [Microcella sp.]|uniref:helicase-associated domain-containing protein n=1 Tax=Microcella sp. TaxID=1913979 RepID=UPI0033150E03